jgi:hypothetical protein
MRAAAATLSAPIAVRPSPSLTAPAIPARLSIEYPQSLSGGLALVKWWLLALPPMSSDGSA